MDVRMPDGTVITGVPDNITQTELLARYNKFSAPSAAPEQGLAAIAPKKPVETPTETPPVEALGPVKQPFTPAQQKEASFLEELKKGATGAFEYGLPSMAEQVKLQGSADSFIAKQKSLDLMNKIDNGEFKNLADLKRDPAYNEMKSSGQDVGMVNAYMANKGVPDVAAQLRGKVQKDFSQMGESADTSIDLLNKYTRENQEKYGPRVQNFTDINWTDPQVAADFANWMGHSMGSAGVQLAPIVLAGVVTKSPGVFTLGSAMETAGAVQNRMEAIGKKTKDMSPAEQKQEIKKYLAETGDANLIIGAASGSFDMLLGPAAHAARTSAKELMKAGAIKKAMAELPKDMLEEAGTGALQEATQIAGKKILEEAPKQITGQDVKDIVNSAMAEAMGAPAGTAVNVGRAALVAPSEKKVEAEEPAREPYTRETSTDAEALARAKGFLTPEAPKAPKAPTATEQLLQEPAPESESQDLQAMLAELEAQLEGKPAPATEESSAVEPVVKESLTAAPEQEYIAQLEKELATPTQLELERPVAEAEPVKVETVKQEPKADLITEAQKYDTPELRLAQADAFGTDVTTALYNETESHGRAALRNRGLTEGYANKKDALADAADAAIVAFGTNDYSAFEPYAQTFPKLAKQLKTHLTPAKPAAVEKPAAAPAPTNLQIAEKDLKGNFEGMLSAPEYSNPEDGWFNPDTNTLHMKGVDGTNVRHYAGDKTATGLSNITPITNAEEARAAVDAGKSFATVQEGSTAVKEAAPAEAPAVGAKAKAKKPVAKETPLRQAAYAKNPFMTFLADKGLYHAKGKPNSMKSEFSPDKAVMVSGHGPVFKASGLQVDAMLPIAIEYGYLPQDATESDLSNLIRTAISGKKVEPLYSEKGVEDTAAKYQERMAEEEAAYEERAAQSDADWYGMSEEDYVNLMAQEVAQVSDADFAELEAAVGELVNTPASNMSERAAMELLGFTEEEIQNEERRTAAKAGEAATREEKTGNEPGEAAPTLELEAQTAEDLKAKQDEIDRLTKENERLSKQAEAKAKADAERDEFVLTGSDRAADVAAAQGQQDIFAAAEEAPAEEQAKNAVAKVEKPEVASEVVPAAKKPAAPQLTREPITIEGEFTEVGEEKQRALITTQVDKLSDAQVSTLEKFYGLARDTEEFANAVRQDVVNFITKGATYVNGKIRAIIRAMANGVLSVAVAFNPQFVSQPYTIAVPQFETRIEQVMQEVPQDVQKQMSEDAQRAYATIYPAIKGEITKNDKFFIVADKQTANTFVFNPDGSPFMVSKTLFGAGIGDFVKGNNNIVSNRITPAGLFDLGLRDAKRSVDEAATAGEYDFGKVFVLDKSQKGANGFYSTTIMHSVWTKETDAKQRLAALQKPGAEDSRYSFGCINVDKNTYGQLVENNLAQMDGAKIFIVPEGGKDVMSFVNGEATYSTDIIRQRAEPVTKETKVEVERAAETPEAERTVVGKEEEGPVYSSIEPFTAVAEEKKRSPSFKRRMAKLNRDRVNGKITDEAFINEADWALKQAENDRLSKEPAKKERGYLEIVKRLAEATKRGDISKESFDLATWFMRNNESLVDDLGVSIRGQGDAGVGGQYVKLSRVMRLIKGGSSNLTIVHEILHHLERMMPVKVQQAIRAAWAKQLVNAQKRAKTPAEQLYFKLLVNAHYGENNFDFVEVPDGEMSKVFMQAMGELRFDNPGSTSSIQLAETLLKMGLVPISNYQYFNPSEFWAVNGSEIVKGRFDAVKGGVLSRLKNWLKELGQKIKSLFGFDSTASIIRALDSLAKADGTFVTDEMLGEGEYKNIRRNFEGNEAPASSWESPEESKMDTFIYKLQDKLIDTKRVIESIKKTSGEIADNWNAYLKEELFHGRAAKRTQDFLNREMLPILEEMKEKGVSLAQFEEYLHMRHAEERNDLVAKRNPKMPDQGSGVKTKDAVEYLASLSPEQAKTFASLAKKFDKIIDSTQKLLVESGLETQDTIDSWNQAYEHYVPLMRDDLDFKHHGTGLGSGYSTKGSTSKSAVGSTKKVIDIFANVALQRERAIVRAEKARVGRALYGLAIKNPNPGFWLPINPDAIKNKEKLTQELIDLGLSPEDAANIIQEPKVPEIDKKTGLVKYQVNPLMRNSDNVFPIRINGEDRYIFFNTSDPRAVRMVEALKNLDAEQLGVALGTVAEVTRWIASVNTQFNPVFGAWNFVRDVQGAAFNLTTTDIAGHEKEVLKNVFPALRGIYVDLRENRKKKAGESEWAKLFEQYQNAGGQTGYRDQFNKAKEKANIVQRELSKLDRGNVSKAAHAVFNWLSDYNDAMENAVRLSAFKVALDQGLSEERAASIAKNLTVNFNRKGAASPTLQALYAFFNAAVQGTARLAQTLKGPAGKKIMAGGIAIGVFQALALAMAGYDDDDPPEFLKNKNLILPVPGGNYLIVPMPLGFNVFPGIGRLTTEYVLGKAGMITGAKGAGEKLVSLASLILDAFNPLGSGSVLQMAAPTVIDPLVSVFGTNRDAFGRPISKEDRANAPTPGYTRSRETASWFSKQLAEFLNYVSSPVGTKYTKGLISPTADQIDYLIGQYTGGTGREVMKAAQYAAAVAKGETADLPSYKVPIVGKLYGETESPAAVSAKFYENVVKLAEHENEIKMRIKNKDDIREYRAEHPEVRFIHRVNNLENQITAINKQKKALQEREAPEERIKKLDERKTKLMKDFNDQIKKLERQ